MHNPSHTANIRIFLCSTLRKIYSKSKVLKFFLKGTFYGLFNTFKHTKINEEVIRRDGESIYFGFRTCYYLLLDRYVYFNKKKPKPEGYSFWNNTFLEKFRILSIFLKKCIKDIESIGKRVMKLKNLWASNLFRDMPVYGEAYF